MPPKGKNKSKSKARHTHRKTTASAGRIPSQALIFAILSRLPAKTLIRFRCVSKKWCSIISMSRFISLHHSRQPASIIVHASKARIPLQEETIAAAVAVVVAKKIPCPELFPGGNVIYKYRHPNPESNRFSTVDLVLDFPGSDAAGYDPLQLIGSPNGIVCVAHLPDSQRLTLWNPATRYSLRLPSPKLRFNPATHRAVSVGFGFDASRNDYKIIRVMCYKDFNISKPEDVEILSVIRGNWKPPPSNSGFGKWVFPLEKCSAVIKGVPYWIAFEQDDVLGKREMLVSCDPQNDVFHRVTHGWTQKDVKQTYVGEIRGCLGSLVWEHNGALNVWMKEDGREWSRIYRFEKDPFRGGEVGFYDGGIVVESGCESNLAMFNLEAKAIEDLFTVENALPGTSTVMRYRESLSRIPVVGHVVV